MKAGLGNLSATTLDQLTAVVVGRLPHQRQPAFIARFLDQTGLTLESELPQPPTAGFQPL